MAILRRYLGVLAVFPVLCLSTAGASAQSDIRYRLTASVSVSCSISEINSDDWADGILYVETRCNAESYRLRLMQGEQAIDFAAVEIIGGGSVHIDDADLWVRQDRPGLQRIAIRVDDPFALQGDLSIRIDAA